jgi:hypothetical protein
MHATSAVLLVFLLSAWPLAAQAEPNRAQSALNKVLDGVSGSRMLADVARLSRAEFNGRQTGTANDIQTARFVGDRLRTLGLSPAGTEGLSQGAPAWGMSTAVTTTQIAGNAHLELSAGPTSLPAQIGLDYLPILDSPSVNVTAPVVFVGYGIADPARGFDEYEGVNVQNRVVLFLRGKPERYPGPVTHADKERVARDKGAVAFLTVTAPILSEYESRRGHGHGPLASYGSPEGERQLPGAWISTALAEIILATHGQSLRETQEQLQLSLSPRSMATGMVARLSWDSTQAAGRLMNVLGLIQGQDASAKHETVVLGAHRDHFGSQGGLLFPGADDNASGTAILLEIARALSGTRPKRSILFASFSGEEQQFLGSRLYTRRPPRPLKATVAMVNVDHAGVGNGRLTVGITGLAKTVAEEAGRLSGLADKLDLFGFFPGGDHVPFKEAGVPTVTIVSGGPHPHFHQASDTHETVQPETLEAVARYTLALVWNLANR